MGTFNPPSAWQTTMRKYCETVEEKISPSTDVCYKSPGFSLTLPDSSVLASPTGSL